MITTVLQRLKSLFEKKPPPPPPQVRHPDLGPLTFDSESLWSGKVHRHGRDIPFVIGGTHVCPNPILLEVLPGLLSQFPDLENAARQFLCPLDAAPVTPADFTFESVDLLWPEKPDAFVLTFQLKGDPGAIWRVEFEAGRPQSTGRDD